MSGSPESGSGKPIERVALMTGAAGGLGSVMAEALLSQGYRVVVAGTDLSAVSAAFASHDGGRCRPVAADLMRPDSAEQLATAAHSAFGRIDILVNNAGVSTSAIQGFRPDRPVPLTSIPTEMLERFYRINVLAPVRLAAALLPQMQARGWGRIINISTGLGTMLGFGGYGGSKAALEAETTCLAATLAGSGVTANALLPGGPTSTKMTRDFPSDGMLPASIMAGPIRFLASDASDGFNGKRIRARFWDDRLPPSEAARIAEPIAWTALAAAQQQGPKQ
ncbi:SDR family NAD(P)-dependent oxidoreductase [Rhizobiaceae sp. 2RAB30]